MRRCRLEKQIEAAGEKTFLMGFEEFLKNCRARNLSEYTIRSYYTLDYVLRLYCDKEKIYISDIDENFFNDFVLFLKDRNIKDTTVFSYCKGMRTVLYFFMDKGYMREFKICMPQVDEPLKETYTKQELDKLLKMPDLNNCSFSELRSWMMIVYFIGTGQRLRTVMGLKIEDIDLENSIVKLKNVKNRKHTILPLPCKVVEALKIYLNFRGGKGSDYLFCSWSGLELKKRGAEEAIRRYNRSRGVEKTSIHAFRHSFATNYLESGGDLFRLQQLMCHSNINVTKGYIHMTTKGISKGLDEFTYLNNVSFSKIKMK